jgi:hypothetical protein
VVEFCGICHRTDYSGRDDVWSYKINAEGGYGMPEFRACSDCMRKAEPGSKMAEIRDDYGADFR